MFTQENLYFKPKQILSTDFTKFAAEQARTACRITFYHYSGGFSLL